MSSSHYKSPSDTADVALGIVSLRYNCYWRQHEACQCKSCREKIVRIRSVSKDISLHSSLAGCKSMNDIVADAFIRIPLLRCFSFDPYSNWTSDSTSTRRWSVVRGQVARSLYFPAAHSVLYCSV